MLTCVPGSRPPAKENKENNNMTSNYMEQHTALTDFTQTIASCKEKRLCCRPWGP